jgi:hypothetical protein
LTVQAAQGVEAALTDTLARAFGASTLDHWGHLLPQPDGEHGSLQQWLWAVPLRNSTHQMGEILTRIHRLHVIGVHAGWPADCNDAMMRHYARRCANRPLSVSKRSETQSRRLEAACFMRYALCAASDQLLGMLRHWIQKAINDAVREIDAARPDLKARIRDLATAVKTAALDTTLSRDELSDRLCTLANQALDPHPPSRRSLVRAHLMAKRGQARSMLARLVRLPFEAQTAHPVIDALQVLRGL